MKVKYKRFTNSILVRRANHESFNSFWFMPFRWNVGMMEYWNIVLITDDFSIPIKVMGSIFTLWLVNPLNRIIFNKIEIECTQYSIIPLSHYSNCMRNGLSPDLYIGWYLKKMIKNP
jgi:hypothetical protein